MWLAGVLLSLLLVAIGLARLTWITSRARALDDGPWRRVADELACGYGLRRRVRVLQSAHPTLLATWGWLRPIVLLPSGAHAWSEDRIRIVLLHELAHITRGDWAMQLFAEIVRSVHWLNPFVWLACRRLQQESERAADDAVLNGGVEGSEYASELLTLARSFAPVRRVWAPAPGIARASTLERRVAALLNPDLNRRPVTTLSRFGAAVPLAALAVGIVSAQSAFSSFSGAVYDPLNGLLPNVRLTLTSDETGAKYEIRSDRNGRFQFVGLPPGRYALESELLGFQTLRGVLNISGPSVQQDVRLQVGSLQETVSVALPRPGEVPSPAIRGARPMVRTRFDTGACSPPQLGGIGGNLRPPSKLLSVEPVYPSARAAAREGGEVVLDARIEADGTIREIRTVSSAQPDFEAAAVDAVRQWQFSETLLNCVPVEVEMRVTVRFLNQ